MAEELKHMTEEADIGSGEKKPADKETEKEIRKVPKVRDDEGHVSDDALKEEEKRKGLVDEDHPFPSKGN
jgi:hypothetical protein